MYHWSGIYLFIFLKFLLSEIYLSVIILGQSGVKRAQPPQLIVGLLCRHCAICQLQTLLRVRTEKMKKSRIVKKVVGCNTRHWIDLMRVVINDYLAINQDIWIKRGFTVLHLIVTDCNNHLVPLKVSHHTPTS